MIPLVDEGPGNSAYLVDLGDGRAPAIDPSRDLRSGGRTFPHRGLGEDDEVDLGGLTSRALTTPGHTPEHLSYLLLDGTTPLGVFTGASLLVGAAARTDLVGAEHTEELARAQYRSLRRQATLPDATAVFPTHGAGSFRSAPPGAERTSTIGAQRAANPYLAAADEDEDTFVRLLLSSLGTYPGYFDRLGEVNRRGPALIEPNPALAALSPTDVQVLRASGAEIIDVRSYEAYAQDWANAATGRSVQVDA